VRLDTEPLAHYLVGFVVGEGCFSHSGSTRFVFEVGLGAVDRSMCEALREFLGAGHVYQYPRRKAHYDDEAIFTVQSLKELVGAVVPFMDEHLPPSYKRQQYVEWRAKLLDYWEHKAKRVRPCTVDGCEASRRAHGLCRHHLYEIHRV